MIITLTTDFGLADGYVGALKGVIASIAPEARVIDISHEIAPGDVRQAAFVLGSVVPYFPPGTIHVAVIDPGVGSARRAIAARAPQAIFIAPDNGLLSLCLDVQAVEIRQLLNSRYHLPQVSFTFHGRDLFAPVAAHLATGAIFDDLGPLVTDPVIISAPSPERDSEGAWRGHVLHIDRFGNVITNFKIQISDASDHRPPTTDEQSAHLSTFHLSSSTCHLLTVEIAPHRIKGLARTYADRAPGELMALIGSSGYLEIAVRDGNAARLLGARLGDAVLVRINDAP